MVKIEFSTSDEREKWLESVVKRQNEETQSKNTSNNATTTGSNNAEQEAEEMLKQKLAQLNPFAQLPSSQPFGLLGSLLSIGTFVEKKTAQEESFALLKQLSGGHGIIKQGYLTYVATVISN